MKIKYYKLHHANTNEEYLINHNNSRYKFCVEHFEKNKFYKIEYNNEEVKIYNPCMMFVLGSDSIEVIDKETHLNYFYNVVSILEYFIEDYIKVKKFFKEHLEFNLNNFISNDLNLTKNIVEDVLDVIEFEDKFIGMKGVYTIKDISFLTVSKKIICDYGFYCGIIYEAENIIKAFYRKNKNEKKQKTTLVQIFNNQELYLAAMNSLLKEGVVQRKESNYVLLKPKEDGSLSYDRWACALGLKLLEEDYFKPKTTDTQIIEALNHTFKLNLSKQNFSSLRKVRYEDKTQDYFSPLFFL